MELLTQSSFYKENFNIDLIPYTGIDYSKVACLFPGNGSLYPGIFKAELKRLPLCVKRLQEMDLFSEKNKVSKVSWYFYQPEKILETEMAALRGMALITMSVGLFESYVDKHKAPHFLSGHSLGECSALVCAGVIDLESMININYHRELIGDANHVSGCMLAVAIDANEFRQLDCPVPFHIANENSPQQTVVSLKLEDLKALTSFLKTKRVASRELKGVVRPYHSPLMQSVSNSVRAWMQNQKIELKPFQIPMMSSVNQKIYPKGYLLTFEELTDLICHELTTPVYFHKQINTLYDQGCRSFLELGVTESYISFVKAILDKKEFNTQSLNPFLRSEATPIKKSGNWSIDVKKSPVFSILSKYISKVTGYEIVEIGAEDYFQEDLRIDSIKKAEIIFRTLEETQTHIDESLSLAQLKSVGDVVEFLDKLQKAPLVKKKPQQNLFLHLEKVWSESPVCIYPDPLKTVSTHVVPLGLNLDSAFLSLEKFLADVQLTNKHVQFVITSELVAALTLSHEQSHEKANKQSHEPANKQAHELKIVDWFVELSDKMIKLLNGVSIEEFGVNLWLITNKQDELYQALKVFFKSITKERKFTFKSVVLSQEVSFQDQFSEKVFPQELIDTSAVDVLYQNGKRYVPQFLLKNAKTKSKSRQNIVVIGGARGLAYEIFNNMKLQKGVRLLVIGRGDPASAELKNNIKNLKNKYRDFSYVQVDATKIEDLKKVFEKYQSQWGSIDLVINSAGIEYSRRLEEKTLVEIQLEISTKIVISKHLQTLKKQFNNEILHFSSIVGEFGNEGQSTYSLGNGYQAALSGGTSVMWPGLDQVGMMSNVGLLQMVKTTGATVLPVKQASIWFEQFMQQEWQEGSVFYADPKDLLLIEFYVRSFSGYEKCVGSMQSSAELIFRKTFNIKADSFLIDHVIETTSVVPASFGMATMLNAGKLFYKKFPRLVDFEIKNVMMLIDNQELNCFSQYSINDQLEMTSVMTSQVEHFVGRMQNFTNTSQIINRSVGSYDLEVDLKTVYRKECIDFGPKFQVVSEAYSNSEDNSVLGIGHKQTTYFTGFSAVDVLMGIFEIAFQSTSLAGLLQKKGMSIPLKIKSLEIYDLQFEQVFAVPEIISANVGRDDLPLVADVMVYNEKQKCIMRIKGLEMSVIRHHHILPFEFIKKSVRN